MTRDDCVRSIAHELWRLQQETGLTQFSNGISDWKDAEDIFLFWDEARMGLHKEGWMSSELYRDYLHYKPFYDTYNSQIS